VLGDATGKSGHSSKLTRVFCRFPILGWTDSAIAYAKQRVQGGVPIFEHQSVKGRLKLSLDSSPGCRSPRAGGGRWKAQKRNVHLTLAPKSLCLEWNLAFSSSQ
jgi:hypothetical protein